jgi:tetratricopeptide (TPR) repeat protein
MDPEEFQRVRAAFERALEVPPEQRSERLEADLGSETELLREAERMLAAQSIADDFLRPPSSAPITAGSGPGAAVPLIAGAQVGPFVLVRLIGSGGMGEVWEALQDHPRRAVALKTLRTELGTERGRRRFLDEAELLARFAHPNIAQVLASGVLESPDGGPSRPWFALELIEGAQPLTVYAARLSIEKRIALLRQVCAAVHHGHLRGVVHRDLKPENCLVDGSGRVRVIDFGIARATDAKARGPALTLGGEIFGTLAYMAPEQVRGDLEQIDLRTDVHALGVLLYELLTGALPWAAPARSWSVLANEICEREPAPPSTRVAGLSRELDWVVAKALAKEPERRYASVQDLDDDLRRFLADEPLAAGPPGLRYRMTKFVRRHRAWVAGGLVAAGLLLVGSAGTAYGLLESLARGRELALRGADLLREQQGAVAARQEAESARHAAEARLFEVRAINDFLDSLLRGADPLGAAAGTSGPTTVADMLDRASAEIVAAFPGRPALEAEVRFLIGASYAGQGRYAAAVEHLDRAGQLFAGLEPSRTVEWLRCRRQAATSRARLGEVGPALAELRQTRDLGRAVLDPNDAELAALDSDLAWLLVETGQLAEAVPHGQAAIARFTELGDRFAPAAASAVSNLARTARLSGDPAVVEAAYRLALDHITAAYGPRSVHAGIALSNLGSCLYGYDRLDQARPLFEAALTILREKLVGGHPITAVTLYNLSALLQSEGELDRAAALGKECLDLNLQLFGPDHPESVDARLGLAMIQYDCGELAAALDNFEPVLVRRAASTEAESAATTKIRIRVLELRIRLGRAAAEAGAELERFYLALLETHGAAADLTRFAARAGERALAAVDPEGATKWSARVVAGQ